jgi:membrane protein DedA with SNARE-associated domain
LHFTGHELNQLLSVYRYGVVMLFVGLESIGMPMPGETMLIAASTCAGTTHDLDIALVIAAASCAAVLKMAILGEAFARAGSYRRPHRQPLLESGRLLWITTDSSDSTSVRTDT